MTIDDVQARIEAIRNLEGDPEAQHSMQDNLHCDVLEAIASGECADPAALAKAALETLSIKFPRWCA